MTDYSYDLEGTRRQLLDGLAVNGSAPPDAELWEGEDFSRVQDLRPDGLDGAREDEGHLPTPIDWPALFAHEQDEPDFLVDDFWPSRRAISVVADRKAGKSLL